MVIGITGVARAGKDTLAKIIKSIFDPEDGVQIVSLAYETKRDLDDLIKLRFGFSAFTEKTEEKTLIRPIILAYANSLRNQSKGTFWTGLVDKLIRPLPVITIVPDVRYCEHPNDEHAWIKEKHKGILIHVERTDENGVIIPPANSMEEYYDPKMKQYSHYQVSWPTESNMNLLLKYLPDSLITKLYEINAYANRQRINRKHQNA